MKSHCNNMTTRRRRFPKAATAATVATVAMISVYQWNAMAFTGPTSVATRASTSPVVSVHHKVPHIITALFASANGEDTTDGEKKLTMELVTDETRHTLLNPPDSRPVLVDAFAPFCGPCKLLDKVLRKSQPRYVGKVDFCRWNVNDKENTVELKKFFIEEGYTLKKLPSLILFREGKPIAVRPGFANEFQLDDWLETMLPDHLERTFDENGVKMVPLPSALVQDDKQEEQVQVVVQKKQEKEVVVKKKTKESNSPMKEGEKLMKIILETEIWQNRTVVPAMDGILLPSRP